MTQKRLNRLVVQPARKLYYLTNHEFRLLQKQILIICLLGFVVSQVLIIVALGPYNHDEQLLFAPFEQIIAQSGQSLLTLISLGFALLIIGLRVHQQFTPGRSIYRLYHLETGSGSLYAAKLIAAATGLLLVLLTQVVSIIAAWFLYFQSAAANLVTGSLQLAFLRSAYLLLLVPADVWHLAIQAVLLFLAAALVISSVLELHRPGRSAFAGLALMMAVVLVTAVLLRVAYGSLDDPKPGLRLFMLLIMIIQVGLVVLRGRHLLAERSVC